MTTEFKISSKQGLLIILSVALFLIVGIGNAPGVGLPWYLSVLVGLVGLVCSVYAGKLADEAEKQRALAHMAGRPALSEIEFGKRYFPPDRAEIAAQLRKIFSQHIIVDLSQLQPNDRFVEDLRMDALDSMATVEFVIEVEKQFGIKIPDASAEKMTTFQSAVDYVSEAVKTKAVSRHAPPPRKN
jgi:acyl carrier protein